MRIGSVGSSVCFSISVPPRCVCVCIVILPSFSYMGHFNLKRKKNGKNKNTSQLRSSISRIFVRISFRYVLVLVSRCCCHRVLLFSICCLALASMVATFIDCVDLFFLVIGAFRSYSFELHIPNHTVPNRTERNKTKPSHS